MQEEVKEKLAEDIHGRRYRDGRVEAVTIPLAREVPYTLFVNDREILSIATLPCHLEELFVGFLVSEGVLASPSEILECAVDHGNKLVRVELDVPDDRLETVERKGMLTSGCAGGMVFSTEIGDRARPFHGQTLKVAPSSILKRMQDLDTHSGIYRQTRGVHGASLAGPDETLIIREDLGRHNAVDKIVGRCFLDGIDVSDKMLLTTGRITSEVLTKASRGGFPLIVSRSSLSALAAKLAQQCSISVAFYVRGGRFNYLGAAGAELAEV